MIQNNVLEVRNLETTFFLDDGQIKAVDNISFSIREGEIVGIVESLGAGRV